MLLKILININKHFISLLIKYYNLHIQYKNDYYKNNTIIYNYIKNKNYLVNNINIFKLIIKIKNK